MSILSGFRKQKRYATDEKGRHQLISTWTHTDTVYDDEGKSLTEIIEELPAADVKVSQTATDTGSNYEVLFSESADNVTKDEGARKSSDLKYSPGDKKLIISGSNNGTTDLTGGSVNISRNDNLIKPQLSIYNEHDGSEALLKSDSIQIRDDYTSPTKVLEIQQDDIVLVGDTWDSSNTSLKTALANAGSKVLYGTSAPTSAQGEDGQLYVQLQIVEPYLDNFIVDYSDEDDIDTELDIENFQECNVNIKQYRMVSNVETLIYEFDEVLDFSYDLGEQYYVKDDEENFICKLTRDNRHSSPQNLLIAKQNAEDKLIMTITDAEITSDAIKNIYIKNDGEWLAEEQGVPSPTASDINKVLMATDEGEYGWEEVSTGSDNICVPPVIYDNGELKKMEISGFPGIEKVYTTPTAYAALTTAEKEDLSKIYYMSDYEFHEDPDHPEVVVRVSTNETKWFFSGYTFANFVRYTVPESLRQYQPNGGTSTRVRVDSVPYASASSTTPIGDNQWVGWNNNNHDNEITYRLITGSQSILNGTVYAVVDIAGGSSQTNAYSDPYDVPGGFTIYYGNKQYTDFDIPDPLPIVTSSDEGKILQVNSSGEWDKGNAPKTNAVQVPPVIYDDDKLKTMTIDSFPGITKVYLTQSAYNVLTTAEKEDLSKIYYISDYEFYPSYDGKVVIRFDQAGTEKLIFFDGFVDDWSSTPYSNFPEELRTIVTNNATWDSGATILSTNYDSEGVVRSGNEQYFGFRTLQDWHVNSCNSSGGSYAAKNKANYAILDMLDNSTYQLSESWSDPYDIPYGYDAIYYGGKEYEDFDIPKELPYVTSSDAGKALVVNSQGIWVKGNIREVPAIHLGDNDKILTVESGEATWASAKKVTHLYDEIPISNPLYFLGNIDPSTSPLTIDMTQHTTNYEELRSTDFEFVFMGGESNLIKRPWGYNSIDNAPGTFSYDPVTGELTAALYGGFSSETNIGIVYKKAIIQLNENAVITGQSGTIDCTDVPNADILTVADFGIVLTNVNELHTSNTGTLQIAASTSYNQTTKQLSWSVNKTSYEHLKASGYVVVGNYGDPEYRLITNFVGASSGSDGYRGYVPSPVSADKDKFLKGDGTWNPIYRELTQAEYDALPSSKNSDGIIYFITDNS